MKRLLFLGELVAMLGALLFSPLWPAWFGRVALLMLPAVFVLLVAIIRPRLFEARGLRSSRNFLSRYAHGSAVGIGLGGWLALWANYTGSEIYLVPSHHERRLQIFYGIENGTPARTEDGARVFDFPIRGPLFTQAKQRIGWYREQDRRFFVVGADGQRSPTTASGGAVGIMHKPEWGNCAGAYTEYAVDGTVMPAEGSDASDLHLQCTAGKLRLQAGP